MGVLVLVKSHTNFQYKKCFYNFRWSAEPKIQLLAPDLLHAATCPSAQLVYAKDSYGPSSYSSLNRGRALG